MRIPIVSWNVSLNNQTSGKPIPPTPMIGMVGRINDISFPPFQIVPKKVWEEEKEITLIHMNHKKYEEKSSYEASLCAWILGGENSHCPQLDLETEKKLWILVHHILRTLKPLLCFPVGHGGVLLSCHKKARDSHAQFICDPEFLKKGTRNLFAEGNMGFVFGFKGTEDLDKVTSSKHEGMEFEIIGKLTPRSQ
jgi:phosphoribosylformylglycinamidine (FGAM) synthase-like enzyme